MATMRDYEIIEIIRKTKLKAKRNNKNPIAALSNGKEYYFKTINTIQNSGIWTMFCSLFCGVAAIAYNVTVLVRDYDYITVDWAYFIGYIVGVMIASSIPAIFGYIIQKLETTPRFLLLSLIVTMVCNTLLLVGIVPVIAFVLNIIALVKWSSYNDWFYRIKTPKE